MQGTGALHRISGIAGDGYPGEYQCSRQEKKFLEFTRIFKKSSCMHNNELVQNSGSGASLLFFLQQAKERAMAHGADEGDWRFDQHDELPDFQDRFFTVTGPKRVSFSVRHPLRMDLVRKNRNNTS
jgi:hypothetical protein